MHWTGAVAAVLAGNLACSGLDSPRAHCLDRASGSVFLGDDGILAGTAARRLADALDRLKAAPPDVHARAQRAVTVPLAVTLEQIQTELKASPVSVETLPAELVADWMTKDGRARIQVPMLAMTVAVHSTERRPRQRAPEVMTHPPARQAQFSWSPRSRAP